MSSMSSWERLTKTMNFEDPDRVPMGGAIAWKETRERWVQEGMPGDVDYFDYFCIDFASLGYDQSFMCEEKVLEEDEESKLVLNNYGMKVRLWKTHSGAFHQEAGLIKDEKDFQEYRHLLDAKKERLPDDYKQKYEEYQKRQFYVGGGVMEPFEGTWRYFGFTELLIAMAERPNFVDMLFKANVEQTIEMHEIIFGLGVTFDGVFLLGDIAMSGGPMFSLDMYKTLLMPHHKRLCSYFHQKGIKVFYHSDGYLPPTLIDLLIRAGIDCLHPLDTKAGMDVRIIKSRYHKRLVLWGGIDERVMSKGQKAIEEEIKAKVPVAMKGGGYVFDIDHGSGVNPTVNLQDFMYMRQLAMKIGTY